MNNSVVQWWRTVQAGRRRRRRRRRPIYPLRLRSCTLWSSSLLSHTELKRAKSVQLRSAARVVCPSIAVKDSVDVVVLAAAAAAAAVEDETKEANPKVPQDASKTEAGESAPSGSKDTAFGFGFGHERLELKNKPPQTSKTTKQQWKKKTKTFWPVVICQVPALRHLHHQADQTAEQVPD